MNNPDKRRRAFFSLRWKIFINLILVLAALHVAYSFYSYNLLTERFEEQRMKSIERELFVLEGLVSNSYDRLLEIGEMIPLVVSGLPPSSLTPSREYLSVIHDYFPHLLINGSLDAIFIYDNDASLLEKQGENFPLPREIIEKVIETEAPVKHFYCAENCLRYVAFPIRLGDKIGALAVGREMRDIILEFKSQSGRDIGLALRTRNRESTVPPWKLQLKYLTHKAGNIDLVEQLVAQNEIPSLGGIFELEKKGRHYQILLQTPSGADPGKAYWILVDDRTDTYIAAEEDLKSRLLIAGLGLLIASLVQVALLRRPLQFFSDTVELLPLLANSAFSEVRDRLSSIRRDNVYEDELDQLKDSTWELSNQLERLEESLLERAQNLSERSQQLESERDFVTGLLDTAETFILSLDSKGNIVSINRYGLQLLGISKEDSEHAAFMTLPHNPADTEKHEQALLDLSKGITKKVQLESSLHLANGQVLQISWLHSVLSIPNTDTAVLSIGIDITERQQAEQRLIWLANHDPLTALPNRLLFSDKAHQAIEKAKLQDKMVAVLFCDMDSFKDINDSLGHPVGDELLQQAAERIENVLRGRGDLARQGSDEFTVLLEDVESHKSVERIAEHILSAFRQSFFIDGYEIFSTVSIGIAFYPEHAADVSTLVQCADVAMFNAKESGKNQIYIFHDQQANQRYERFSLLNDLRRALERNELRLYYQPQVDARSGTVMGVEALLRWFHPEHGLVSPAKFIPLAEEQGLIVPIGEWVLEEACRHGKMWHDQGMLLRIGVNLAGQQIMHESLLPAVERVLNETGIDPKFLDLEVTENFLLRQPEITIPKLQRLREMGMSLSMDDFGTGYSSLSYLKKLPLNTLKIDQSFVRDIGEDVEDEAIVKAIIVLAHSLGLESLAEGVETSEQLSYLRTHGCHKIQGFYFSKPLPADELPDFVMNQAVEIGSD